MHPIATGLTEGLSQIEATIEQTNHFDGTLGQIMAQIFDQGNNLRAIKQWAADSKEPLEILGKEAAETTDLRAENDALKRHISELEARVAAAQAPVPLSVPLPGEIIEPTLLPDRKRA